MTHNRFNYSGMYNTFAFDKLARLTDDAPYRKAKKVVRLGTCFLPDLVSEAPTTFCRTRFFALAKTLDKNIDEVAAARKIRPMVMDETADMGNKLWETLVKFANIGKNLFEFTNEAMYNDCVLTSDTAG